MYLQITSTFYTHTTNISQEEKELGLFEEMDEFAKDMVEISESMLRVCAFFHAAITLEKEHVFNPGFTIFIFLKFLFLFSKIKTNKLLDLFLIFLLINIALTECLSNLIVGTFH